MGVELTGASSAGVIMIKRIAEASPGPENLSSDTGLQGLGRTEVESDLLTDFLKFHPDLLFILSDSGIFLGYHAAEPSRLVIPPERFLHRHVAEVFPSELSELFLDAMSHAQRLPGVPVEIDHTLPCGDEIRHYEARYIALPDRKFLCIVREVTRQICITKADHDTAQLRVDINHAARVGLLNRLAPTLIHELRQPLAAVLANAAAARRLLARSSSDSVRAELQEAISGVAWNGDRATQIIEHLQAFAQKSVREYESLDVSHLVEEVAVMTRGEFAAAQVALEVRLSKTLPAITGDRVQLQQVVVNLLLNAVDAASLQSRGPRVVTARTSGNDSFVEIEIEDNGPGIGSGDLGKIFQPFFSTKKSGTGLGLAISADIVRTHGGWIDAANRPRGGAKFRIGLPAAK